MMVSRCSLEPERHMLVQAWRMVGERPFGRREIQIVELLLGEVNQLRREGRLVSLHAQSPTELTPRLEQVLDLLARGLSEKEIAAVLGLSAHTVHDHVKRLHQRFGVSSRGELLAALYRWNGSDGKRG